MRYAIVVVAAVVLTWGSLHAEIPQVMGYQGMITDNSGQPVGDGTYTMKFSIFNGVGDLLWNSGDLSVQLKKGIFSVNLGESPQPALDLPFDEDYLLMVTFEGEIQSPPRWLGSTGYAYMASGLVPGTNIEASMTSQDVLTVKNTATSGSGAAVRCWTYAAGGGPAVYGYAYSTGAGENYGVYGVSRSMLGRAVYGSAWHTTGDNYGVYGKSLSTAGIGVYGEASPTSGYTYGVYGKSYSNLGYGVCGEGGSAGGYFKDRLDSGRAHLARGNGGIYAYGNLYGAHFLELDGSGEAYLATEDGGIEAWGDAGGGEFNDLNSTVWARVASSTYKVEGSGNVSFVQNHPEDDGKVIVYAAPEGDEVATYTRGTSRLVDGEARVPLGETFKWVTNPDIGLTAHLTPQDECNGLRVAELTTSEMVVRELGGGTSDARFDYLVHGLRIGFEEVSIVQEKQREAYIPSMSDHRERYATYPELRRYNALERFKAMCTAVGETEALDLSASRALRDAIEEFDPARHKLPQPRDEELMSNEPPARQSDTPSGRDMGRAAQQLNR